MRANRWVWAAVHAALCLLLLSSTARAKSYKSGELETKTRYGFGAFEARIRAAQGPGVISTFFLWKPGSEQAPSVPWHEIDFELGQASGDYWTQVMTPGSSPPLYRTEHGAAFNLPSRAYQAYYTYRIEWTPDYIAFYVDGQEVRRETDKNEFAPLFMTDSNGDTPTSERMELRTGAWPALSNIFSWAGNFDGSTVPTAHFVDYVKVWKYTPNQANKFATVLLDEQFNSLNTNAWYPAQWTFEFSASDYVSQNVGTKDGRLVVALTTEAGAGILPSPPADVPPVIPTPPVKDGFVIEAEKPNSFYDTTAGNEKSQACGTTDVDAERTSDPTGGTCNVAATAPGEWLQYDFTLGKADEYTVTLRIASAAAGTFMHLEIDGEDVSGPVQGPGSGWQSFVDALIPGVQLSAGPHSARVVFDTGDMNLNYLTFERVSGSPNDPPPNQCLMSCDDGNPCTNDSCDAETGCHYLNNTLACADDGNACTSDVCSAGVCTHPANNATTCADDGNACTSDICSAGVCTHPANNAATCADDGNACTSDICSAGVCTHPANNATTCADDGNACTSDVCSAGVCTHPANNAATCADDGNACTSDVCSAGVCTHPANNATTCADDGNACTSDVCSAGVCTHPANNSCNNATPCAGLCDKPVIFSSSNYNSGNLGTGAGCYQTTADLRGGVCGNLASGRKLTVNGTQMSCNNGNWASPLPAKRNGGYCVQTTAGNYAWAYFATW